MAIVISAMMEMESLLLGSINRWNIEVNRCSVATATDEISRRREAGH